MLPRPTFVVHEWSVGVSNHLQDVGDWVILVRVDLSIVVLCIHDDDLYVKYV